MTNLAGALLFLGFVALAIGLASGRIAALRGQAGASRLIVYVIVASCGAALTARDFWPFSYWHMMQLVAPEGVGTGYRLPRLVGVTASGAEYRIDYRAWEPLDEDELMTWLKFEFPNLRQTAQDSIGRFLLAKANAARAAVHAGRAPGTFARVLGPFTAPTHEMHRTRWTTTDAVPADSFVQFRMYDEQWSVEGRARDSTVVRLVLFYQYPRAR